MASDGAASSRPPLPPSHKRRVSWDQRPSDVLTYKRRRPPLPPPPPPPNRRSSGDRRPSDLLTYQRRRRATNSNSIATNSASHPNTSAQMNMVAAHSSNPQQAVARHWISWRNTLEGFLQSLGVNQGSGGIQSCIRDALRYKAGEEPALPVTQGNLANAHGEARESPSGPVHGQQNNGTLVPDEDGTVASLEANRAMCNNALFDMLVSEQFALLCDSLTATFHINKPDEVIGLANIDARMRNGDYAQNPKLLEHDMSQILEKIEQFGRKMADLANSLSFISPASYNKQASGLSEVDITEHKTEETSLVAAANKGQRESKAYSDHSTKPDEGPDAVETQESAVASREEDSEPDLSTTALSSLCKHCGTCEDEDKLFLVCGHPYCSYKFYHIRCLKQSQIALEVQKNRACWYCPSCLCRVCFQNKDDECTVLCDLCDEAYHIYCMNPPQPSIPKGKWYCAQCSKPRAPKSTMQGRS